MEEQGIIEAGVRGRQAPDKTSAGDDIPRGPVIHPPEREYERQGTRRTQGVHTVTTQAQIHVNGSDSDDPDAITQLPPVGGVHSMVTRAKGHMSADGPDPHLSLPREPFRDGGNST
jgi:hypothetical protein